MIRLARADDAAEIQAIYAPIVENTVISFEMAVPSVDDIRQRIESTLLHLPWLVAQQADTITGYVYAHQHRARAAYQWSADVSVYIHQDYRSKGIGRALYTTLFQLLKAQGFYNAFAGITLPNPASVGIHTAMGFQPVGIYRSVGYKFSSWHDVGWWQLPLRPYPTHPTRPEPIHNVYETPAWDTAIALGMNILESKSAE